MKPAAPPSSWSRVVAAATALPETEQSTSYGTPALKVRGKLFARLWEDGETLVVRTGPEREALLLSAPQTFFVTPHYQDTPWILVRVPAIADDALRALLRDAWLLRAPRRLVESSAAAPRRVAPNVAPARRVSRGGP